MNHRVLTSIRGVVRNADGAFLFGFITKLGACTITIAELWAILLAFQPMLGCLRLYQFLLL